MRSFSVLLLASTAVATPLTTIVQCAAETSKYPDITVTSQYQPVSTCIPTTTSCAGANNCTTEYSFSTSTYVSTVIPCAWNGTAASSCTITTTNQAVPCSEYVSTETSVSPVTLTNYNHTSVSYSTSYKTISKEWIAPYNSLGPLAIPGWEGSGLCGEECDAQADGSRAQNFEVNECSSASGAAPTCAEYAETWYSYPAPSATAPASAVVSSQAAVTAAGDYTFSFPQWAPATEMTAPVRTITITLDNGQQSVSEAPASVVTVAPQPWWAYVTTSCHGPTTFDFTVTVTKTITYTLPPYTSSASDKTPIPAPTGGKGGWADWQGHQPSSTSTSSHYTSPSSGSAYYTSSTSSSSTTTTVTFGQYPGTISTSSSTGTTTTSAGGNYPGQPGGTYTSTSSSSTTTSTGTSSTTTTTVTGGVGPTTTGGSGTTTTTTQTGGAGTTTTGGSGTTTTGGSGTTTTTTSGGAGISATTTGGAGTTTTTTGGSGITTTTTTGGVGPTTTTTTAGGNAAAPTGPVFYINAADPSKRFKERAAGTYVGFPTGDDAELVDKLTASAFFFDLEGYLRTGLEYILSPATTGYTPFEKSLVKPDVVPGYSLANGVLVISGSSGQCISGDAVIIEFGSAPGGCREVSFTVEVVGSTSTTTTATTTTSTTFATTTTATTTTESTTTTTTTADVSGDADVADPTPTLSARAYYGRHRRGYYYDNAN